MGVTDTGSLWMIASGRRRWASTLKGFEMFEFGAQYAGEIKELTDVEFRKRGTALRKIPGMGGLLPGTGLRASQKLRLYFLDLSENAGGSEASNPRTTFTFDRREAALTRRYKFAVGPHKNSIVCGRYSLMHSRATASH